MFKRIKKIENFAQKVRKKQMKKQIELMNYIMYDYNGPNPDRERK